MGDERFGCRAKEWKHVPSDCLRFHIPFNKLCQQCFLISQRLKQDAEVRTQASERHFHKTLEATLKMYQDHSKSETWEKFRKVADMLAAMHQAAKRRLFEEFAAGYNAGAAKFSRDFIMEVEGLYAQRKLPACGAPFPARLLEPVLCSPSDPPMHTFSSRRRILKARRRIRPLLLPKYRHHPSSSSDEEISALPPVQSHSPAGEAFADNNDSVEAPSSHKRVKTASPASVNGSHSDSSCGADIGSYSPSTCSVCSDEDSSDDGNTCCCTNAFYTDSAPRSDPESTAPTRQPKHPSPKCERQ
uniref:Uncharacterized protein n=1 Tax=Schistocephalus solidus TaxID=70667 RepID=A0A0X3QGN9_SCHSO